MRVIYLNTAGATIVRALSTVCLSFRSIAGCTRTAGGKSHCKQRDGREPPFSFAWKLLLKLGPSLNPHLSYSTATSMSCLCLGFYPLNPDADPDSTVYETRIETLSSENFTGASQHFTGYAGCTRHVLCV